MPAVNLNGLECQLTIRSGPSASRSFRVIFGDIWLCLGQSNMLMSMGEVAHSEAEIQDGKCN